MYLLLSHLAAITAFPFYPNQPLAQGTSKHHQSRDDTRYQLSFKLWDNGEFRDILCTSLLQWYSGVDYCTVSKAYAHDSMTFANPIPPQNKNCPKFSWFEQLRALLKMRHLIISKHILTVAPIHRFCKFQPHHSIVLHGRPLRRFAYPRPRLWKGPWSKKSVDMSSVRIWIQQNRYSQIMRHCKQDRTIETEPRRTVDLPQN